MIYLPNREHAPMACVMLCCRAGWHGADWGMLNTIGLLAAGDSDRASHQSKSARPQYAAA